MQFTTKNLIGMTVLTAIFSAAIVVQLLLGVPAINAFATGLIVTICSVFSWLWLSTMQSKALRWSLFLGALSGMVGALFPTAHMIWYLLTSTLPQMGGIMAVFIVAYFIGAMIYGMAFTAVMSIAFPFRSSQCDTHQELRRSS